MLDSIICVCPVSVSLGPESSAFLRSSEKFFAIYALSMQKASNYMELIKQSALESD